MSKGARPWAARLSWRSRDAAPRRAAARRGAVSAPRQRAAAPYMWWPRSQPLARGGSGSHLAQCA